MSLWIKHGVVTQAIQNHVESVIVAELEIPLMKNGWIKKENEKNISSKTDIGWGHQIRSYVLQPYQLVKDLRNKVESTNPDSVLDGNIDKFIEEGIKNR